MIWNGPRSAPAQLILAHGAGAPMDSPFMEYVTLALVRAGIRVGRFEFPYMAARRETGRRRPPDRPERLLTSWRQVIDACAPVDAGALRIKTYIGGKSMGGRMASLIADDFYRTGKIAGLVCLGYPFHAPGKQNRPRTAHLADLETPTLILQGERDAMGSRDTVAGYELSPHIAFHWAPDGNHDLAPRKRSGFTEQDNRDRAIARIVTFIGRAAL